MARGRPTRAKTASTKRLPDVRVTEEEYAIHLALTKAGLSAADRARIALGINPADLPRERLPSVVDQATVAQIGQIGGQLAVMFLKLRDQSGLTDENRKILKDGFCFIRSTLADIRTAQERILEQQQAELSAVVASLQERIRAKSL